MWAPGVAPWYDGVMVPRAESAVVRRSSAAPAWWSAAWLGRGLIVLIGAAVFANGVQGVFVYDDPISIVDNPPLRSLWPHWPELWARKDTTFAGRPVVAFTFALNYALSGFDVWSYHVFNIAVHVLCGLALFGILRRTPAQAGAPPSPAPHRDAHRRDRRHALANDGPGPAFALAVTLLWLIHPLHVNSVTYVCARTETLAALFLLLTLHASVRAYSSRHPRLWTGLAILTCALGMGSKEVMAVAPLLVLLHDRTFLSGSFVTALWRRAGLYAGLAATWVILILLWTTQPRTQSIGFNHPDVHWWEYALTQFGVLVHYLRLTVWPWPLSFCHDGWPVAKSIVEVGPEALAVLALLGAAVYTILKYPRLGFLAAWCVLILAPTSSVIPVITETMAERRMYLPLAAVLMLLALAVRTGLVRVAGRAGWPASAAARLATGLACVLIAAGAAVSVSRNLVFSSVETAWHDVLRTYPTSPGAHLSLATEFYRQNRTDEGIGILKALLVKDPGVWEAHYGLGHGYLKLNRLADAARHYGWAVQLDPNDCRGRTNYGGVLLLLGRAQEAREQLEASLAIRPEQPNALYHLGGALETEGHWQQAAQQYIRWLEFSPDEPIAHLRLGLMLSKLGHPREAEERLRHALRLQPDLPEAKQALARLSASR